MLQKTDTRVFNINDFIGWDEKGELNLNPSYQRDAGIWDEKTKSFLIDTIVRGLPIPPIYVRLITNVKERKITREIIDGKQRLTTILSFYRNEFPILEMHNTQFGGKTYEELDEETQIAFLNKDISVVLVYMDNEAELRDIFTRLNSSNTQLNAQELRNAKYQSDFKIACYDLAKEHKNFFLDNKILSQEEINRMQDAEFISKIMFLLIEGEKNLNPKTLDALYESFENNGRQDVDLEEKKQFVCSLIAKCKLSSRDPELIGGTRVASASYLQLIYVFWMFTRLNKTDDEIGNLIVNGLFIINEATTKIGKGIIKEQMANEVQFFNPFFLSKAFIIGMNEQKALENLNNLRKDEINTIFDLLDQLLQ